MQRSQGLRSLTYLCGFHVMSSNNLSNKPISFSARTQAASLIHFLCKKCYSCLICPSFRSFTSENCVKCITQGRAILKQTLFRQPVFFIRICLITGGANLTKQMFIKCTSGCPKEMKSTQCYIPHTWCRCHGISTLMALPNSSIPLSTGQLMHQQYQIIIMLIFYQ